MFCTLSINVPSAVSSLVSLDGNLVVGSDDGTVRVYELPSTTVARAIRSLGSEVSSICVSKGGGNGLAQWYFASGPRVFGFLENLSKIIATAQDATTVFDVGEDEDDVLNEISLSSNGKTLAFSTDSGTVGVVDLSTKRITRMRTRHTSICGSVKFIPDRPSELISGGYDSALLHYDFQQGTLLSRHDITAPPPSGVSLSPPFVLSISVNDTGLFAMSTADGRVWIGAGGEKCPHTNVKKKRSRKWEGLNEDAGLWVHVAEGPVVAVTFCDVHSFVTCTLLGTVARHSLEHGTDGALRAELRWSAQTQNITKVNAIAVAGSDITVGGLTKNGKGVVEMWGINQAE